MFFEVQLIFHYTSSDRLGRHTERSSYLFRCKIVLKVLFQEYSRIRKLKMQTFSERRRREERLRLGQDWLRMRPRRHPHVDDVRSVGLPSRWKRELILFVLLINTVMSLWITIHWQCKHQYWLYLTVGPILWHISIRIEVKYVVQKKIGLNWQPRKQCPQS